MARIVLIQADDPEAAASAEMRYLRSLLRLQAERTFGEATLVVAAASLDAAAGADYVLLLGSGDVLLRGASLAALRGAVDAGADVAVPHRLADSGLAAGAAVYTLRDFEALERRLLSGEAPATPGGAAAPSPVALLTGKGFAGLAARHPELFAAGALGTVDLPAGLRVEHAGLCHEFIDYYGEVRADVVPYLPADARDVLEVGCGRGATGRHLQETLGCRVTGVELNPVVARHAATVLHRVVVGDVEDDATVAELTAEPGEGRFDALLATELFEHLVEPERLLARVRHLVRPGGRMVLSVPNVGHYSVVEDLLAGRWDYLPIGILCYTHYRFYTGRTLADWLARCGFPDARLVPQRTEAPPWLDAAAGERLAALGLETDPESLTTKGFYVVAEV